MNNYLLKKLLIAITFAFVCVFAQVFMYLWFGWGFWSKYILLDLTFIIIMSALFFLIRKPKTQIVFCSIIFGLELLLIYTNICVMKTLDDVFSLNMLTLVGETAEVLTGDMFPLIPVLIIFGFVGIFVTALVFICKKIKTVDDEVKQHKFLVKNVVLWLLTFCFFISGLQVISIDKKNDFFLLDDAYLYKTFSFCKDSLKKFGLFTFYSQQIARKIYDTNENEFSLEQTLDHYQTKEYENKESLLFNVCEGNNVIAIMAESFEWYAIDRNLTPTLYALANGYDFSSGLDFYVVNYDESGNATLVFDETKYNDALEEQCGITLTNYYSKAKTDYSEDSVILGNYPFNRSYTSGGDLFGGFSAKDLYENVDYGFSLPNMLKNSGGVQTANYYHNYMAEFYGRNKLIPQFGFDSANFIDELENVAIDSNLQLSHCVLDSEMVAKYKEQMFPKDETFFTYFTTVTTHGEFSTINPLLTSHYSYLDTYYNYLGKEENPIPSSEAGKIRTFLASCLDTEWMMTIIIDYLINNEMLDNTTIAFFADHQAYYDGLDLSYKPLIYSPDGYTLPNTTEVVQNEWAVRNGNQEYYMQDTIKNAVRYNVPCFIYSPSINDESVAGRQQFDNKFTCAFDITTTLLTLAGVDYDENYYLGYPVKCEVDGVELGAKILISHTGGIFNERIYSEDGLTALSQTADFDADDIEAFTIDTQNDIKKRLYLTMLYEYNLFAV